MIEANGRLASGQASGRDLVVFSHLRWDGVWQRPHHVVSRLAPGFRRTWFVEEPASIPGGQVRFVVLEQGPVSRVVLETPGPPGSITFDDPSTAAQYASILAAAGPEPPVVWLYQPLAVDLAAQLRPRILAYDVMDDLSSFQGAPPQMRLCHVRALAEADVVVAGGRSLHERVLEHRRRPARTLCLPSGVDAEHFRHPRVPHRRPVAGYVGVIDERLDLGLLAEVAGLLPGWWIRMVGPVTKIPPSSLPRARNIQYLGTRSYAELPAIMAGFDVALMPFAINEATASISPTKTLEYMAAGLPIVSTPIRDVVRDHHGIVHITGSAHEVARICEQVRSGSLRHPAESAAARLSEQSWDRIVGRIEALLAAAEVTSEDDRASA
jgi:glycosyltransferase involved in cell wall biosynthesis